MINGFYDVSEIKNHKVFFKNILKYCYRIELQEKYKKSSSRERMTNYSIEDFFIDYKAYKGFKRLDVIDRNIYGRGQVPDQDGEIVFSYDWTFLYLFLSLENLAKIVNKYNLKLKQWNN